MAHRAKSLQECQAKIGEMHKDATEELDQSVSKKAAELKAPDRHTAKRTQFLYRRWRAINMVKNGLLSDRTLADIALPSLGSDDLQSIDYAEKIHTLDKLMNTSSVTSSPTRTLTDEAEKLFPGLFSRAECRRHSQSLLQILCCIENWRYVIGRSANVLCSSSLCSDRKEQSPRRS